MLYVWCYKDKPGPGKLHWDSINADTWLEANAARRKRAPYGEPYGGPYVQRCAFCSTAAERFNLNKESVCKTHDNVHSIFSNQGTTHGKAILEVRQGVR